MANFNSILLIQSSPRGSDSITNQVSQELVATLQKKHPAARVVSHDLSRDNPPHLTGAHLGAFFTPPEARSPELSRLAALSDRYVDELLACDALVIAAPMWNFTVPSALKSWIDHIVRVKRTFEYTAHGPKGLVPNKRTYLVLSAGGMYEQGPAVAFDHLSTYLRGILGFLGITDVHVIRAEGTAMPGGEPEAKKRALAAIAAAPLA